MGSTFDIFKITSDGPLWVEAVLGLEKAKEQMARLALSSPGEYFIHSQEQGVVAKAEGADGDEYSLPSNQSKNLENRLRPEATKIGI